jgi:hypothetical protein
VGKLTYATVGTQLDLSYTLSFFTWFNSYPTQEHMAQLKRMLQYVSSHLASELGFGQKGSTTMWEDNKSCVSISKNLINHKKIKHIDISYFFIREKVEEKIEHCGHLHQATGQGEVQDWCCKTEPHQV